MLPLHVPQFTNSQPPLPDTYSATIRIIIADDHPLVREGLVAVLQNYPDIEIIGQVTNGRQLVQAVKQCVPDIVITDLRMPEMDGLEAIAEIRKINREVRCIAISQHEQERLILDAVKAGALGFLIKTADKHEIYKAILSVYRFNPFYCHTSARKLNTIKSAGIDSGEDKKIELTDKEKAVLRLICEDKSSKEIGRELFISGRTVEGHKQRIKSKIGKHTTVGIVLYAVSNGLYQPPVSWYS